MKKIFNLLLVLVVALGSFTSCEPDPYVKPDIALTPVYAVTDIADHVYKINVYKQKSLLTSWADKIKIVSYETTNYEDTSDDTNYMVKLTAVERKTEVDSEGNKINVVYTYDYEFTANMETGAGTMTYTSYDSAGNPTTSYHAMMMKEDQVYN